MPRHKRYDASNARKRAGDAATPPTERPLMPSAESIILLPLGAIRPAPWQARKIFDNIEALAASIAGDLHTQGVSVLQPLLVRRQGAEYEIIDGERRWRACEMIATRLGQYDLHVPCRVVEANDALARLMGHTANLQRQNPRALEVAFGYQSIRDALDLNRQSSSVRGIAKLAPHDKTQVSDYLAIADALTPEVFARAGLLNADQSTDYAAAAELKKATLHKIAKIEPLDDRAAALAKACGRGAATAESTPMPDPPEVTVAQRRDSMNGNGFTIRVKRGIRSLEPAAARELLSRQLTPAMFALASTAGVTAEGGRCFVEEDRGALLIVIPTSVDALAQGDLDDLAGTLRTLSRRVRATRRRRRNTT